MKRALILGAVFVDVVVDVPSLPVSGSDVTGDVTATRVGGCAYNVYGALKAAGQSAELFTPVGFGQYAELVRADFRRHNIPVNLPVTDADNGWDLALVEPNGERSFLTINGIEQEWQSDWFDQIDLKSYDYFYISGYELENPKSARVILAALAKRRADSIVIFDSSPRAPYLPVESLTAMLRDRVMIHCNADEIAALMPTGDNLVDKLMALYARTHCPVVVTRGAAGTVYYDGQRVQTLPAAAVPVINTMGAGDSHCGGMLAGLMSGLTLAEAIEQADAAAAQVIQQVGGSLIGQTLGKK